MVMIIMMTMISDDCSWFNNVRALITIDAISETTMFDEVGTKVYESILKEVESEKSAVFMRARNQQSLSAR